MFGIRRQSDNLRQLEPPIAPDFDFLRDGFAYCISQLDPNAKALNFGPGAPARLGNQTGHSTSILDYPPDLTPFSSFAQGTFFKPLDPWQYDLCTRLEDVTRTTGRRILISVGPQFGKTVMVSQRWPAWNIGINPLIRIRLLMYNLTHSTQKGGRVCKDIVQSSQFRRYFDKPGLSLPQHSKNSEWSTAARNAVGDGQPTFKCFGLDTGATGEGGDLWIIDDPYPSEAHAFSDAHNASIWSAWEGTVKPRLGPNDNVVVMFHRYQVNDLAGMLLTREVGEWEFWRYPALADGDYHVEGTGQIFPAYPPGRALGERLSRRYEMDWYETKRKSGRVWRGQFQGRPTEEDGDFFNVAIYRQEGMTIAAHELPANLPTVRAWDFAATEGGGARSAGVKMAGPDRDGFFYILDSIAEQKGTAGRMKLIRKTAEKDGLKVKVGFPKDPGSAGVDTKFFTARALTGFQMFTYNPKQDKELRAQPFADAMEAGLVKIVMGPWVAAYLEELRQFPTGAFKDQVDASADAFKKLAKIGGKKKRSKTTTQNPYVARRGRAAR